jgi:ribonuclease HI
MLTIHADGGSRGNPGPGAIGIVILDESRKVMEKHRERIGRATNNIAEYKALIKALDIALRYTNDRIAIVMDSELVIRQMKGQYKVRDKKLKPLYDAAKRLEKAFSQVNYKSVSREDSYQAMADALVNEALDSG